MNIFACIHLFQDLLSGRKTFGNERLCYRHDTVPLRRSSGPLFNADQVVSALYVALLGREPVNGEEISHVSHLAAGFDIGEVVAAVMTSSECQLTYFRNPNFRYLVAPDPLPAGVPRLYLWHIPKTAGTSLREMLMPHFDPEDFCGGMTLSELTRLSPARLRSFRVIAGHFGPTLPRLLYDVPLVTVTLVRDPVDTVASFYRQVRDLGPAGHAETELARSLSFDEWCRCQDVRSSWSNPQARALALERHVSGWPDPGESPEGEGTDLPDDELRARAVGVLKQIDIVGTPDDLVSVCQACLDRLDMQPDVVWELKVNVSPGSRPIISPATRDWLTLHNTVDTELFELVRNRRRDLEAPTRL
jgi:hypothetical protein